AADGRAPAHGTRARPAALLAVLVGVVAFGARAYLLRYAQLTGEGTYDDAVHFSGSLALVHGRLPYRDFLFLHPPMVLLALTPFAGLAQVTSESFGFAAARVAWMLLGAFNAIAVTRLLRPLGLLSALVGGLAYALYFPAAYAESTTMLEGLANAFLLSSLLLLAGRRTRGRVLGAGILLGLVPAVKIWGVVMVAVVLVWAWAIRGLRHALAVALAAAGSCALVVLPFFLAAPARMWTMVVAAQLGRPELVMATPEERIWVMLGLFGRPPGAAVAFVLAGLAAVVVGLALWRAREFAAAWLGVGLLVPMTWLLMVTPSFYGHYPAAIAVPFAITLGAAVTLAPAPGHRMAWLGSLALLPVVLAWATAADLHLAQSHTGADVRFAALAPAVAHAGGCVTSEDPAPLIELGLVGRNIARGCPVWIDLTGHYLIDNIGQGLPMPDDPAYQEQVMTYLRSGSVAILGREYATRSLSEANLRIVDSWPVLARSDAYTARRVPH
ncbi:MAG: hypothetical protein QM633_09670, partial [Propionicimonas sp.]